MKKHTISILIAENNHYFAHGLSVMLKAFCQLRGRSLRLVNRHSIPVDGVDIVFLGNSVVCPLWLHEIYQQGYAPRVFFIRDRERDRLISRCPPPNVKCGAGMLYRDQTIPSIEAMLDNVFSPKKTAQSPFTAQCRCTPPLTHRETEVLQSLAMGISPQDTAGILDIKIKTVETYKRNAMRKLSVRNNQELYQWIAQGGAHRLNHQPEAEW